MKKLLYFSVLNFRRGFVKFIVLVICRAKSGVFRVVLSDNSPILRNCKILQPTQFLGAGRITIENAKLGYWPSPFLLSSSGYMEARFPEASIDISGKTVINNGFVIIAERSKITISPGCLIGSNVFITDSDFHKLDEERFNTCKPVYIEEDVFIGADVKILKGVRVGKGAVIGAGSVVVSDVEPKAVVAGVPAKEIRKSA